jgi:hypothetical protein
MPRCRLTGAGSKRFRSRDFQGEAQQTLQEEAQEKRPL